MRVFSIYVRLEVIDEIRAYLIDVSVFLLSSGEGIFLCEQRFEHERHLTIYLSELEIGPCAVGLHDSILLFEYLFAEAVEGGVGILYEVVAVIDYGIVVADVVILVWCAEIIGSHLLYSGGGIH